MKKYFCAIALALVPAWAFGELAALEGVYERVSLANAETGFSPEKGNRKGLLQMANGHYSMMTMNTDRRVLGDGETLEGLGERERLAYLEEWLDVNAHSGRYEANGDTLIWHRDISENPNEVGTTSRLEYELRDELLVLSSTLPNGDRYEWLWRRIA